MAIERVGIVGAGTMGSGIATNIVQHGIPVHLVDVSTDQLARAQAAARQVFDRNVERGRMTAAEREQAMARLTAGQDIGALADADLVIEAVFERHDVKAETFGRLNQVTKPGAIVATNTSCLEVAALARTVKEPSRFLGLHYFSPAAVNPLVEVVRGPETDETVVAEALAFARATTKRPLVCRDRNGFAVNRFFCPFINEAARLMDDGVGGPAEIDQAAKAAVACAAGPFVVMNLVKPRIALHAIENLRPLGAFYESAKTIAEVGGSEGSFTIGEAKPLDPAAEKTIVDRLRGAVFLPVLQELDEEVASPDDIDMGAELALKFAKPPCALMDELGKAEVERVVAPLCKAYGAAMPKSLAKVGHLRTDSPARTKA